MATPLDKLAWNAETGSTARIKINKAIDAIDTNTIDNENQQVTIDNGINIMNDMLQRITNIQHDNVDGKTKMTGTVKYESQYALPTSEAAKRASTDLPSLGSIMTLLDDFAGGGVGGGLKRVATITDIYEIAKSGSR